MVKEPLFSIVIITRNRKDILRKGLALIDGLSYCNREVIVVDNGSTDSTPAMLDREFPNVRVISFPENRGIAARNAGIRASQGNFVLTLDDDVSVVRADTLECLVNRFNSHPNVGLICLRVCDPGETDAHSPDHWWYQFPRKIYQLRSFYIVSFCEAAVAFRRSALDRSGLYFEPMFWGGEDRDLALRLLDVGADMMYMGECAVIHWGKRGVLRESADARHRLLVRNAILTAALRLPWHMAVAEMAPRLLLWCVRSIRYGYFLHYLVGLLSVFPFVPVICRERRCVRRATRKRIKMIRAGLYWDALIRPVLADSGVGIA